MSRFFYDNAKVSRGLDYLKEAKQKLNGITVSMNRGISTIQNANGYKYINVDFSSIKSLEEEARTLITSLEALIDDKIKKIEDYNAYRQEHPIKSKFIDFSMGATNIVHGAAAGVGSIGDGALAVAGAVGGAFGNETWKKCCEEELADKKIDKWFNKQYESGVWSDVEKYSSYSSKSTKASVFKGIGSAVPFVAAAVATGGASAAGSISGTTALAADSTLAAYSALGDRTSSGLANGEDFDTAYNKGVKSAAVAGATTFAIGKGAEKLSALRKGAKGAKQIEKTETLLIDKSDDVARNTSKAAKIEKAEEAFIGKNNGAAKATKISKTETLLIEKSDDAARQATKTTSSVETDVAKKVKKVAATQTDNATEEAVRAAEKKANDVFAEKKAILDKKLASGEINKAEYRKALKDIHPDTATYNAKAANGAENVAKDAERATAREAEKSSASKVSNAVDDTAKNTSKQTANKAEETFKNSTKQATNTAEETAKSKFPDVDDDVINIDDGIDVLTGDANKAALNEKSIKGQQSIKSKIKNQFNNAKVRDAAYTAEEKMAAAKTGVSKAQEAFKAAGSRAVENAKAVGTAARTIGANAVKNPKLAGATVGATAVVAGAHINPNKVNADMEGVYISGRNSVITASANEVFASKDVAKNDTEEEKENHESSDDGGNNNNNNNNDGNKGNGNGGSDNSNYASNLKSVDNTDNKTKKILDAITKKKKEQTPLDPNVAPQEPTEPNSDVQPTTNTIDVADNTTQQTVTNTPSNTEVVANQVTSTGSSNSKTVYTGPTTVKGGTSTQASYSSYSGGSSSNNSTVASVTKDVINNTAAVKNNDLGSKVKTIIGDKKINPIVIDDTTSSGTRRSGTGLAVGGVVAAGTALGIGTKAVLDKRKQSEEYDDDDEVVEETIQNDGYDIDSAVYDDSTGTNEEVEMLYDDPYKADEGTTYDDSYDDLAYGEAEDLVTF